MEKLKRPAGVYLCACDDLTEGKASSSVAGSDVCGRRGKNDPSPALALLAVLARASISSASSLSERLRAMAREQAAPYRAIHQASYHLCFCSSVVSSLSNCSSIQLSAISLARLSISTTHLLLLTSWPIATRSRSPPSPPGNYYSPYTACATRMLIPM
jgi:hypothetical protein